MSNGNPEIMGYIGNRTFDEIRLRGGTSGRRTQTKPDIELFAVKSGDLSPNHLDKNSRIQRKS